MKIKSKQSFDTLCISHFYTLICSIIALTLYVELYSDVILSWYIFLFGCVWTAAFALLGRFLDENMNLKVKNSKIAIWMAILAGCNIFLSLLAIHISVLNPFALYLSIVGTIACIFVLIGHKSSTKVFLGGLLVLGVILTCVHLYSEYDNENDGFYDDILEDELYEDPYEDIEEYKMNEYEELVRGRKMGKTILCKSGYCY